MVVVGIGVMARRAITTSEDFLLSGRSLPAWITGLASFVLYGVLLTVVGLFDSAAEIAKADGIRINLWIGLAMLLLGLLFLLWVWLRPLHVERPARGEPTEGRHRSP